MRTTKADLRARFHIIAKPAKRKSRPGLAIGGAESATLDQAHKRHPGAVVPYRGRWQLNHMLREAIWSDKEW